MKFSLIIYALLVIYIKTRKVNKKKSEASSTSSAGNTATTHVGIQITKKTFALKEYIVSLNIDEKDCGKASFTIESINKPNNNDQKLGWNFKLEKGPTDQIKNVFVGKNNTYYLPYRSISGDIIYSNPFGAAKYFEIFVTDDKSNIHQVVIYLPFADAKSYINDEEANILKSLINTNRIALQGKLSINKKKSSIEASKYVNIKPFANSVNKTQESFKAAVDVVKTEMEGLAVILKSDSETFNDIKKDYDKVEKNYVELRNRLSYLNERISESKNLRIFKDNSVKLYKDKKADTVKEKLIEDEKKFKDSFEKSLASITAEVPSQSTVLEDARLSVIEKLDLGKYTKLVANVYAGI